MNCLLFKELLSEIDKKEVEDSVVSEDHSLWGQAAPPQRAVWPKSESCVCVYKIQGHKDFTRQCICP